jgi:hypothetical protein
MDSWEVEGMSDTPRTDEVFKAVIGLGFGSMVEIPTGYPPCDVWELARQLERELNSANAEITRLKGELERASNTLAYYSTSRDIYSTAIVGQPWNYAAQTLDRLMPQEPLCPRCNQPPSSVGRGDGCTDPYCPHVWRLKC